MERIFLSHPHSNSRTAIAFAHWLEEAFAGQIDVICTSEPEHEIDPGKMVTTGLVEHIRLSSVVLVLVTHESLELPWLFYEMGAAHALGKVFIPCVAHGVSLRDLPPQAYEYQGAELSSREGLAKLVRDLSHYLNLGATLPTNCDKMAGEFA